MLLSKIFLYAIADTGTMTIDWRAEIWPFQSRMILKGMMNYFHSDFMGPVLFHFHGAVAAGQLGVTWQILNSLRTACSSWVRVRYPRMGNFGRLG